MRFSVENIGLVENANIAIDGITVVAGANSTGKSTIGKALWCVFNSFHDIGSQANEERVNRICRIVYRHLRHVPHRITGRYGLEDLASELVESRDRSKEAAAVFLHAAATRVAEHIGERVNEDELLGESSAIVGALETSDRAILETFVRNRLTSEFAGQPNCVFNDKTGKIAVEIKGEKAIVEVSRNGVTTSGELFDLYAEAVYFDDPFVLDDLGSYTGRTYASSSPHRLHLRKLLERPLGNANALEAIEANERLRNVNRIFDEVCRGSVITTGGSRLTSFGFAPDGGSAEIQLPNLSSGLKTFVMLKMLLENGSIEQNGTIILDEPEIHLHPAWQLFFAEAIVLLQVEFGLHVLLASHSPYFIRAIEIYAAKYGIADKCRYYFATNDVVGTSVLQDVTNDREVVYHALFTPLQDLEDELSRL